MKKPTRCTFKNKKSRCDW